MKTKNIAFVLPSLSSGGAERVAVNLANGLCAKYNITFITLARGNSFYKLDNRIDLIPCSEDSIISNGIFDALKNNYHLYKSLYKIFKTNQIDLVIAFTISANALAILASKRLKINSIISERSNPNIYIPNAFWRRLRKLTYKYASKLVVQTEMNKENFSDLISKEHIEILPNPISQSLIEEKVDNQNREPIILTVGRLDTNKAHHILIEAFSKINSKDWKVVIVGDGDEKQNLVDLTSKLNLESKIIFVGKQKNVSSYYNNASIFAFTSRSEGFPNVLIEAMYYNLAVISTDCPYGPSEIIENGKNGFLINVDDTDALAEKLEVLINNDEQRSTLAKAAFESAKSYMPEDVINRWDKLIEESF